MWSSENSFRRRIIGLGFVALLASGLSGCFTPLYLADKSNDISAKLRAIEIVPVSDRLGHYIGTELIFLLNGSGESVKPLYRLTIDTKESNPALVVDSQTGRADSASIFVTASFKLVSIDKEVVLASGQVSSAAPYDRSSQRFSNLRAARDGEIRVAKSLANDIKNRIATVLAIPSGAAAP